MAKIPRGLMESLPQDLNLTDNPFERGRLAQGRLLAADPMGAARALLGPRSLALSERKTLAERWGLPTDGPLGFAMGLAENPLVLWGLVMSVKYPIPLAKETFKYAQHLGGRTKMMNWLSRGIAPMDDLFAGTAIPERLKKVALGVDVTRRKWADPIAEAVLRFTHKSGRKFDPRMAALLAAKLDGLDKGAQAIMRPIEMGPHFETLVSDVRTVQKAVWDANFGDILKQVKVLEATATDKGRRKGLKALYSQLRAAGIDTQHLKEMSKIRKIEDYFPHVRMRTEKDFAASIADMLWKTDPETMRALGPSAKRAQQQAAGRARRVGTSHALARRGELAPDPKRLDLLKDYLIDKNLPNTIRQGLETGALKGTYSLDFTHATSSYIQSMARAHVWTVKGEGPKLLRAVEQFAKPGPGRAVGSAQHLNNLVRANMVIDSYIPQALGKQTQQQSIAAAKWASAKLDVIDRLQDPKVAQTLKEFPGGQALHKWVVNTLSTEGGVSSLKNVSHRLAGWLYMGALGLNPVSAAWNTLQLVPTAGVIGPKWAWKGVENALVRVPKYFKLRMGSAGKPGLIHDAALAKVFPEFFKEGLVAAPIVDESIARDLNRAWEASLEFGAKGRKASDRLKAAMMAMFQSSENFVRTSTFEGALAKAKAEGLGAEAASTYARRVVETTQFTGGAWADPSFMREWNPLMKQFGRFPFRYMNFLVAPGTSLGSAGKKGLLGRNWGTLGRTALTSAVAYEAAKEGLGADISPGLLFGALPIPNPNTPGSPIPFIPPGLSAGLAVGQDLLKGEFEASRYALPLMIPGGVALSRLSPAVDPHMAKLLGRGYADYNARTPDGRVPMFTKDGNLRGYFTDLQIWMDTLGVPPGGDPTGRKEQDLQKFLLAQRDRMRDMRRRYLDAEATNDGDTARAVQEEWARTYPGMGPLHVTQNDRRAVHLREFVPRIERLLETLPKESRGQFGAMIQMYLAQEAESLLGVDPALLSGPSSIKELDPGRPPPPPQNVMEALYRKSLTDQGYSADSYLNPPGQGVGTTGMGVQPSGPFAPSRQSNYYRRQSRAMTDPNRPGVTPFAPGAGAYSPFGGAAGGY